MSQPPQNSPLFSNPVSPAPQWRRPAGVAPGTWEYVNERSIADRYDAFVADTPLCRLDSKLLCETFPSREDGRPQVILDLGCGSGRASLLLAQRGYDVIAIDLSLHMLDVMMTKARLNSMRGRVHPLHANLVQLDCLGTGTAEHAICLFSTFGMIQGRAHRHAMLRQVARIVRGDGRFLMHVHNRWAALCEPRGCLGLAKSAWRSLRYKGSEFGDADYAYRGLRRMFMHRFSRRELLADLRLCGLEPLTVWPVSIDGSRILPGGGIPGGYITLCRVPPRDKSS